MNSNLSRRLSVSLETPAIMRYMRRLVIAQILFMILFATWMFNL
jgi:hypothetical protein